MLRRTSGFVNVPRLSMLGSEIVVVWKIHIKMCQIGDHTYNNVQWTSRKTENDRSRNDRLRAPDDYSNGGWFHDGLIALCECQSRWKRAPDNNIIYVPIRWRFTRAVLKGGVGRDCQFVAGKFCLKCVIIICDKSCKMKLPWWRSKTESLSISKAPFLTILISFESLL